jgi:RNA polymerase sporulation-specific sigma factor
LPPREKEIIVLRYGLKGYQPRTQRDVAKYLGISRSYVSRIEKKALERLKDSFGSIIPCFDD